MCVILTCNLAWCPWCRVLNRTTPASRHIVVILSRVYFLSFDWPRAEVRCSPPNDDSHRFNQYKRCVLHLDDPSLLYSNLCRAVGLISKLVPSLLSPFSLRKPYTHCVLWTIMYCHSSLALSVILVQAFGSANRLWLVYSKGVFCSYFFNLSLLIKGLSQLMM